ncbi:MAG: GH32 C-terminal domain-containing protein [Clostridia bacterium]|nr:GH32 C-terminal domain-containing protein [Clostridia bacterium]
MMMNGQISPLERADAFWDMQHHVGSWRFPYELEPIGEVLYEKLEGDELDASEARGLNGFVCRLNDSCLSLNSYRAAALRPKGDSFSFYMRLKLDEINCCTLLSSDFLGLTLHPSGYLFAFLAQEIPTGNTYRELPLARVTLRGWCDLVLVIKKGILRFYLNGELKCSLPIKWRVKPGFWDDFVIGGRRCCKPDTCGTTIPHARVKGLIDAVALWQGALSDEEIAFLSGCDELTSAGPESVEAVACAAYNAFFDASADKNLDACREQFDILRGIAVKDESRPLYHLTQPFGAVFDPVGAFWYEGKYHIFSYRNVNYLLEYSSLDHYVSEDLIHWTEWPIGPFTDSPEDVFCIYLLNHFIDEKGNVRVLYTGQGHGGKCGILADSNDGMISYTNKKTVLPLYHHDGHVFRHGDRWYTITSRMCKGQRPDGKGDAVMLFSSDDLENWVEEGEIFAQPKTPQNPSGFLEFPYLLFFGERALLMVGGDIRYYIGRFDWETKCFIPDNPEGVRIDSTDPFYCFNPMCVDHKGEGGSERRIVMGLYPNVGSTGESLMPWSCVHTMPRVLTLEDDHIRLDPVPESEALRGVCHGAEKIILNADEIIMIENHLPPFLEMSAVFSPQLQGDFGLLLSVGADEIRILYHAGEGRYEVSGAVQNPGSSPAHSVPGEPIELRVFMDRRLIEIYVNGQVCTTSTTALSPKSVSVGLISENSRTCCESLRIWELEV